jgi:hypothetical protein
MRIDPKAPANSPAHPRNRGTAPAGRHCAEPRTPAGSPASEHEADQQGQQAELPERPPMGGAGSSAGAWRAYAAAVTGTPVEQWSEMSRDDIVAALPDTAEDGSTPYDGDELSSALRALDEAEEQR